MPLTAGVRLGHYEIVGLIGAGGMGEVYRARDSRLNRTVAIKVLLDDLSQLPEARERFEREAQAIASLNHPHIATLHDVGRHEQTDFLVMEMLEGETLAEHLARGPVPILQAMQYALEIAAALDQAHRNDIVHRDLKPANIMITKRGVKLLDFGLAKLRSSALGSDVSATRADLTSEGTILGTLQYMAPEQLDGRDADARTDIFSFGTVLHEMVTGRRAFDGKSRMSLIGSILRDTPTPVSTLQPAAPLALDRLVATCVAKDPVDRWQSVRDILHELTWISQDGAAGGKSRNGNGATTSVRTSLAFGHAAVILLAVAGLAAVIGWWLKPGSPVNSPPVARLTVTLPPGQRIGNVQVPSMALSPDGSALVYLAEHGSERQLFVRMLDTLETRPVMGTEGATIPFFSPDGQWIGFFAAGKLKKTQLTRSAPIDLCSSTMGFGGTWGSDGAIYFVPSSTGAVWKVPDTGGTPQAVTIVNRGNGEVSHRWPQLLPGGKAIIFTVWTGPGSDEKHLYLQMLSTGERRLLLRGASTGRYIATGHLFYFSDDALMAVPFDLASLQVTGQPTSLPERAMDDEGALVTVSESGTLAYVPAGARRFERRLVWVDMQGTPEALAAPLRPYSDPAISPNGLYAAFTNIGPIESVWIHDFVRGTQSALTSTALGSSQAAVWTADGSRIVYRGTRAGFRNIFSKAVDGSGDEERLTTSPDLQTPVSSSPNRHVAFVEAAQETGADIWVLPPASHQPRAFQKTSANEGSPHFSPDGLWLAYSSTESGIREVYVRPFPGPGVKLSISSGGGSEPVWSRSGRELFYRAGDRMMSVSITTSPALAAGRPKLLFEGRYLPSDTGGAGYDVSADGRFLMVQPVEPNPSDTSINVVINWFGDLKGRLSARHP